MRLKKRKVSSEKIRRLGEILDEFLIGNLGSEFPVGGVSNESQVKLEAEFPARTPQAEPSEAVEQERDDAEEEQLDDDDEAGEAYDEEKYYFDLAEVEYCVDVAITEIINEELVPGYTDPQKPPTLFEIFEVLFGVDHELTKQIDEFEEYISGYDDHVHVDDLQEAYDVMSEIVKELKSWGGK